MIQEGYKHLAGHTGYLLLKIPQEILREIKISVDSVQSNFNQAIPLNNTLAGQIDKEYKTTLTQEAIQYIEWAIHQYDRNNPKYLENIGQTISNRELSLNYEGDVWVNFQEKYEYNPMHNHSGVFSYVIWYQIPFYRENEIKYGAGKGKDEKQHNKNGDFEFLFPIGNNIFNYPLSIDKKMEGYMAVFPSYLNHVVYPFYTSDDYRITISGNIFQQ
jgi:hypothetical protein